MTWILFLEQCLNGLQFGLMLFLLVAGLTLIFGIMDVINLAHGSLYMVGAYLVATLTQATGSFLAAVPLGLAATASLLFPLSWIVSGRPQPSSHAGPKQSLGEALREAFGYRSFWLLNAGFFVCGFHVVFYGVHLPAYVADRGMPDRVAVTALVLVGLGNLVGTYLAGQWGKAHSKRLGLSLIYLGRAFVFLGFLYLPITETTILALSGLLGLLWLSTVPLTSTLVATFFGPAWMTMLYGIVFFSHQIGSFLGVWLGGVVFDRTHSYDTMWWISVLLGVFAALVHLPIRESQVPRPAAKAA
jgi:predicted MFS family arabinose efflux permease